MVLRSNSGGRSWHISLGLHVHNKYLHWAPMSINSTDVGPFGALGYPSIPLNNPKPYIPPLYRDIWSPRGCSNNRRLCGGSGGREVGGGGGGGVVVVVVVAVVAVVVIVVVAVVEVVVVVERGGIGGAFIFIACSCSSFFSVLGGSQQYEP